MNRIHRILREYHQAKMNACFILSILLILSWKHAVNVTAKGIDIGLLLNFGADKLQFKRKYRTYRPKQETED